MAKKSELEKKLAEAYKKIKSLEGELNNGSISKKDKKKSIVKPKFVSLYSSKALTQEEINQAYEELDKEAGVKPKKKKVFYQPNTKSEIKQGNLELDALTKPQVKNIFKLFKNKPEPKLIEKSYKSTIKRGNHKGKILNSYIIDNVEPQGKNVNSILQALNTIFMNQKNSFSINLNFAYELYNTRTKQYKTFYESNNTLLFKNYTVITDVLGIKAFAYRLKTKDLIYHYTKNRPSTEWSFSKFISAKIWTINLGYPIGAPLEIPSFIKSRKSIITLDGYDDNLCFFRAYVIHLMNQESKIRIDRTCTQAKKIFEQFYNEKYNKKEYAGIIIEEEVPQFEAIFDIGVNIFEFNDDKETVCIIRRSIKDNTMNVLLYRNHFCYIKDIELLNCIYKCIVCDCIFKNHRAVYHHEKTCKLETRYVFPTEKTYYTVPKSFVEKNSLQFKSYYYQYFATYDFESLLVKTDNNTTLDLKFTQSHVPVSVSICSNVEGYTKPKCFISNSIKTLVQKMVKYLTFIANKACMLKTEEFAKLNDKDKIDFWTDKYCKEMPVLGFNSAKYDLALCQNQLFDALRDNEQSVLFSVKNGNTFRCLATEKLKFLDVSAYLAVGFTYDKFVKSYDCDMIKGFFPYEWFDSFEKLDYESLPAKELFYSSLKREHISDDDYKVCVDAWNDNNMKTFKDFLKWYNNRDVEPFVQAVEKMLEFHGQDKVDLFKDSISIPKIAVKKVFNSTETKFRLIDEENKDIFPFLRRSIVGGPSIIFHRYHEVDVTKIRGGKICKSVKGFDANALYLWAMAQEMPSGDYIKISLTVNDLLTKLDDPKFFAFCEVDIYTPDNLKNYFSEMQPIFKNTEIKFEDIGEEMQQYAIDNNLTLKDEHKLKTNGRKLIGSYFGDKVVLITPLLKWYLKHGLIIKNVYMIVQFTPDKCFQKYCDDISDARRKGDLDKKYEILAETRKLEGNAPYGYTVMNKDSHTSTLYCDDISAQKYANKPFFREITELGDSYEIKMGKRTINQNLPLQIGCAVYQYAKLRMLQFYYDLVDKYIDRTDFQYCEMDTDSAYMALSKESFEECIKPDMKKQYLKEKYDWLPHEMCSCECKKCEDCKLAMYERRTAGLFKIEFDGSGIIALASKMYYCWNDKEVKFSSKGVNKKTNDIDKEKYMKALLGSNGDLQDEKVTNRGFRVVNNQMVTYEQKKKGFSYYYDKRILCEDGISTLPTNL